MMSGRLIEMNASPWLWIETTWVIIFSALDLALRIIVRSHEYGLEDTLLVLAFRFAMASFGCIYQALYDGLGISPQSLLEARTLRIAKLVINSSVLCFIAESLSKLSTAAMLYKIICRDPYLANTPHLVVYSQGKTGLEAILVISILIESFIFLLSSYLFGRLNMKVQNELTVVTIFGMRLPLVLISAYFLVASKRYTTQNNPSDIIYGTALYWQIALVGHSVLATAIQPLKRAATSFSTHSNMLVGNTSQGSMSGKSSKLRSSNKTRRSLLLTETPPTPLSIIWSSAQAGDRLQDSDSIESHPLRIISL
ncbi:hypothetical protein M438DRAFT_410229 [Aureobasidium pullulans EXF-150]|uniref:Integral membrane protein n=1 Tax=Aureobasidium pullulans EXF-150 TaxID=1043002 RepID=A0A074XUW4_AURPU|nr:uncharacterized protein M438DRAFT_410229 [Aureobasidium pullulans EXF-150]KEQ78416.1 hypothetical protein M438DRAFT_410229 [Aureobasidium pullulans EXF-150]